mmetsp:Transcript_120881/g.349248  ORF Transcript_120881/g.349248 Transcript_120881/m.349248 type:complete len:98 (+) Transcript_120881:68-361(+)
MAFRSNYSSPSRSSRFQHSSIGTHSAPNSANRRLPQDYHHRGGNNDESMAIIRAMSDRLETGLNDEALRAIRDLLEAGAHPDAVVAVVGSLTQRQPR